MYKCLLFDCDGTLVDSERLCNVGLSKELEAYGIQLGAEELLAEFRGWQLANILEKLQSRYCLTLAENFVENYRALVSTLFESELKPIANIEYALQNLPQSKAVVSNAPREKIEHALSLCGLKRYFDDCIYSAYEIGAWKPDPVIYKHAAIDMGFTPGECAAIDDGLVGVEASYQAGIHTFFYNPYGEICEHASIVSFSSMKELPNLIHT